MDLGEQAVGFGRTGCWIWENRVLDLGEQAVGFRGNKKIKVLGANAMKRTAAGAHPPNLWLFEPAKRPDDITD